MKRLSSGPLLLKHRRSSSRLLASSRLHRNPRRRTLRSRCLWLAPRSCAPYFARCGLAFPHKLERPVGDLLAVGGRSSRVRMRMLRNFSNATSADLSARGAHASCLSSGGCGPRPSSSSPPWVACSSSGGVVLGDFDDRAPVGYSGIILARTLSFPTVNNGGGGLKLCNS